MFQRLFLGIFSCWFNPRS